MWVTQGTSLAPNKRLPVESFSNAAQRRACATLPVEKVFLSTNRSLLAAGAPAASGRLLCVNHILDPRHPFCTALDNLAFNGGGGYAG